MGFEVNPMEGRALANCYAEEMNIGITEEREQQLAEQSKDELHMRYGWRSAVALDAAPGLSQIPATNSLISSQPAI